MGNFELDLSSYLFYEFITVVSTIILLCVESVFYLVVCVRARGVTGTIGGDSGAKPALYRASSQ